MEESGLRRPAEGARQGLRLFGNDVEAEDFDRDESIARGLIRAKDRAKGPHAGLVKYPERPKSWRRCVSAGVFSGQRRNSVAWIVKM